MKSVCLDPFTPPEPLGTAITDFTPGGVSSKTCKKCHRTLPLSDFEKSKSCRGGRRTECRVCKRDRKNAYYARFPEKRAAVMRRWLDKGDNRARINARNVESQRQQRIASRPPTQACACGNYEDFRWHKDHWVCVPCAKSVSKLNKARRNRERFRRKSIRQKSARLLEKYGPEMAAAFDGLVAEGARVSVLRWKIIRRALPPEFHTVTEGAIWRITTMNRLQGKPLLNLGWTCTPCGIASTDNRFFDFDHVVPRCQNGAPGANNLQVLCPNCHRLKTISDLLERKPIRQQLDPPAQDHWQAGTVTTIDAGAEANTPPTASTTSLSQP